MDHPNDNGQLLPEIQSNQHNDASQAYQGQPHDQDQMNRSFQNRGGSQPPLGQGKSSFIATKERKDVERDAQLLANRIALLRQEEMKTWKKIEETKKRAGEVTKLKHRNADRMGEKIEKMQYEQMISNANRQRINQMRKERMLEKSKLQQSILMTKHDEARQAKMRSNTDQAKKLQNLDMIHRMNAEKKNRIRMQEDMAKKKNEEIKMKKIEDARFEIQRQIQEEERLISSKEQEVIQMEMLEMELIKKLQQTQAIQKQAYLDLESAIQQKSNVDSTQAKPGYRSEAQGFGAGSQQLN